MASKKVKDLKPKDLIYSAFLDGRHAYACWATIESINKVRVYDSKISKFRELHEMVIRPTKGAQKEEAFTVILDETSTVKIPPSPTKFQKIWRAITS